MTGFPFHDGFEVRWTSQSAVDGSSRTAQSVAINVASTVEGATDGRREAPRVRDRDRNSGPTGTGANAITSSRAVLALM